MNIYVPEGKSIKFDQLPYMIRHHIRWGDTNHYRHHHLGNGETWTMTNEGFINPTHKKKNKPSKKSKTSKEERSFSQYKNFKQLYIQGKMKVTIEQADQYAIKVTGREQYINKVQVVQNNEELSIKTDLSNTSSPIRVTVQLPTLSQLKIAQTDDIRIADFKEEKLRIETDGESRADIKAFIEVQQLELELNSRTELDLRGSGTSLVAQLSDRSELDASHFAVKTAQVTIKDRGAASLAVSDTLVQAVKDRGTVRVDGEPVVIRR